MKKENSAEQYKITRYQDNVDQYKISEYPRINRIIFPDTISIAYAVCGKKCGVREFIVDGQTQVCQHCGKLMFRTIVKKYRLMKPKKKNK